MDSESNLQQKSDQTRHQEVMEQELPYPSVIVYYRRRKPKENLYNELHAIL